MGEETLCVHRDNGLEFYADYNAWDRGSDYLISKLKRDKQLLKVIALNSKNISVKIITLVRKAQKQDVGSWSNQQIAHFLNSIYRLGNDLFAYGFVPVLSDHFFHKFTHLLKGIVKEKSKHTNIKMTDPEIVFLLSSHGKFVPSKFARLELLNILEKWDKSITDKKQEKQIKDYYDGWFWVDFGHLGPGQNFFEVLQSAKILSKNKSAIKKEVRELKAAGKI